jgi:hypothetical protein
MSEREAQAAVTEGLQAMIRQALAGMGLFDVPEANECRRRLAIIHAKEFLKASDAAYLLGCSENHLRNLVKKAQAKKTGRPIPFIDLDGTVSFPRAALLEWAGTPKPQLSMVKGDAA